MSLQSPGTIQAYAQDMYRAWCVWDTAGQYAASQGIPMPEGAPALWAMSYKQIDALRRRQLMIRALQRATGFLPGMNIVSRYLGDDYGQFTAHNWTISLNSDVWSDMDLEYPEFIEACGTLYHEARHAEQYFRIAQGLACGRLHFRGGAPTAQELQRMHNVTALPAGASVAMRVAGINAQEKARKQVITAGYLRSRTGLPLRVARAALDNARANFDAYIGLGCPNWYRNASALKEVDDWYASNYTSYSNHFAYQDLPEEYDAFAIEKPVENAMKALIGVQPRAMGRGRARDHRAFDHLPTA